MIRRVIPVPAEENQITGLGKERLLPFRRTGGTVQPEGLRRQGINPVIAGGVPGERFLRHLGIIQAERYEHGAPVAVRRPIPGAVSAVPFHGGAVAHNNIIAAALGIVKLGTGNGLEIHGPVPRKRNVRKAFLP